MRADEILKKPAHLGYSDDELEFLSRRNSPIDAGKAPWAAWESENSSFGKTFRTWAMYPSFLPLFFSSDHGVHWGARCWPNEIKSPYRTFFTWNRKKSVQMGTYGKKSYHVPHPWVYYRNKYYPSLPVERLGTLVFFAHSNKKTTPIYRDLDGYVNELKSLPEKYQPVVFCLSFHDISKGIHKTLRKYGIPLVTGGTTGSQAFVDRFYSLSRQFRYASSPNVGSHAFYLIEAGVPFFLYGVHPEYHIQGSQAVKDGKQDIRDYGDEEDLANLAVLKQVLTERSDEVTDEQKALVAQYLGLDSEMTRMQACGIFWRELVLHLHHLPLMYLRKIYRLIEKIWH
jgi:hypothetical protein